MKTQQGFYKYKSPHNLHVININYYNNYSSMNKYNTLYTTNYNNNYISNINNRKNIESNNSYINKRVNTENDDKYFVKSHNYFSKNYKSIKNAQRKNKNYSISISSIKTPSKTNTNFYSSNNYNTQNQSINQVKNITTLPSINVGYFPNNNSNINNNNIKNKNKINNSYDKTYFNKRINNNNNTFRSENSSYINNLRIINSNKNNNNYNNDNDNSNNNGNKNNFRYFQNTNHISPTKINTIKDINFNTKNTNYYNSINNINNNGVPTLNSLLKEKFFSYKDAKYSEKSFDKIVGYGVNTFKGTIRNYNEDRISVVVNAKYDNIQKRVKNGYLPKVSYFAIYDGHAGSKCCEFLKNNLHNYIFESNFFPDEPIKAIEQGFNNCEKKFVESIQGKNKTNFKFRNNKNNQVTDFSGSCSIIILIIDDICYTVNLGDSRALYSCNSGNNFYQLSRDHKPNDPIEKERIYKAGGSIFKSNIEQYGINIKESELGFKIPFRILPGRLAVSKYLYLFYFIYI